jgi:hypothetical protein
VSAAALIGPWLAADPRQKRLSRGKLPLVAHSSRPVRGGPKIQPSLLHLHLESTMQRNAFHRTVSLCLAAVVTLALLGGIDQLAQPEAGAGQMAQAPATRA